MAGGCSHGILRYLRLHDPWSVYLEQRDLWSKPPTWLKGWHGDGIISRATTPQLLEEIARTKVPFVEVTDRRGSTDHVQVRSDDAAIGRLAAEHLIDRGFRRFAFCGFRNEAWSMRREEGFIEAVAEHSWLPCAVYNSHWHGPSSRSWDDEHSNLVRWIKELTPTRRGHGLQ